MARNFVPASAQYLDVASAVVAAAPLTMACWAKPLGSNSAAKTLMGISRTSIDDVYHRMVYDETANTFEVETRAGTGTVHAATQTGVTEDAWNHFAGVYAASNSRFAYVNGSVGTENTGSGTPASLDTTVIGVLKRNSLAQYFAGDIAEAAIWNVALTAAEIASLADGFSPRLIRPDSLVAYWPLIGRYSPEIDLVGGFGLTLINAPAAAAHPRIIYPSRTLVGITAAGGGGVTGQFKYLPLLGVG